MNNSLPVFEGAVRLASGEAFAEVVGDGPELAVRFASSRHARAFARSGGGAAAGLIGLLPPGAQVRIEVRGREVARFGADTRGWWTPAGLLARLSGLPLVGIRPAWWIGLRG